MEQLLNQGTYSTFMLEYFL